MRYAIVENNTVVNIVISTYQVAENWIPIPTGACVGIDDVYDGSMFYSVDGDPRLSPEVELTQDRIKELEQDNVLKTAQIQALSDRNDFLEDCIAEMAGLVYA